MFRYLFKLVCCSRVIKNNNETSTISVSITGHCEVISKDVKKLNDFEIAIWEHMYTSFIEKPSRIYIDYENGKSRKVVWLNQKKVSTDLNNALIGFHAFLDNCYISSFLNLVKR